MKLLLCEPFDFAVDFVLLTQRVISTNVPANDYPQWSGSAVYAQKDRVIMQETGLVYESLISGNQNNNPQGINNPNWIVVGPMNRWAMFDGLASTATTMEGVNPEIVVKLQNAPSGDSCIAFVDTNATEALIEIRQSDGSPTQFSRTVSFSRPPDQTGLTGIYNEGRRRRNVVVENLPYISGGRLEVTLRNTEEPLVSCGAFLRGRLYKIGDTQFSSGVGIQDYSKKDTDQFGNITVVERAWSKRLNASVQCKTSDVDAIQLLLASVRAKPTFWVGSDYLDATTIYGYFKSFDIDISGPRHSRCSLQIEGLTT